MPNEGRKAQGCRMKRERHKDAEEREKGTRMPKEERRAQGCRRKKGTMVPVKIGANVHPKEKKRKENGVFFDS